MSYYYVCDKMKKREFYVRRFPCRIERGSIGKGAAPEHVDPGAVLCCRGDPCPAGFFPKARPKTFV